VFDPITNMAETDAAILDDLLREVNTGEAALQALLAELADGAGLYGEKTTGDTPAEVDRAEELRQKWGVVSGQLWELGSHRLICGDCTDAATVARVMAGERAQAVVTDSPYGMNVEGVENDSAEGLDALFDGVLKILPMSDGVCVNFQGPRLFWKWLDATRRNGHTFERALWLYKPNDGTYPWRGWLQTGQIVLLSSVGKPLWGSGEYKHDTYQVNYVGDALEKMHATPKPLDVIGHICGWVSPAGGIVYEPFSGSGTTIIACENLGRRCRACEISPGYVGVALERYFQHTGVQPVLLESAAR